MRIEEKEKSCHCRTAVDSQMQESYNNIMRIRFRNVYSVFIYIYRRKFRSHAMPPRLPYRLRKEYWKALLPAEPALSPDEVLFAAIVFQSNYDWFNYTRIHVYKRGKKKQTWGWYMSVTDRVYIARYSDPSICYRKAKNKTNPYRVHQFSLCKPPGSYTHTYTHVYIYMYVSFTMRVFSGR